jgi:hypothetical protein
VPSLHRDEPVLVLKSSRVLSALTGSGIKGAALPQELLIFADRLEVREAGAISGRKQRSFGFGQVANVGIKTGLKWSTLTIETTDGDSIVIENLSRRDAKLAKLELELGLARQQPAPDDHD